MSQPEIISIAPKKLICTHVQMSFLNNRTQELWRGFMPRLNEIKNRNTSELISLQVYPGPFDGNPTTLFDKYACVEVQDYSTIPQGMETLDLIGGLYAVFHYKGLASNPEIFKFIFTQWLPSSEFQLDLRPHFEVLGSKYKNNDPDSEEDIYIPIIHK